jgi:hypothetical protein
MFESISTLLNESCEFGKIETQLTKFTQALSFCKSGKAKSVFILVKQSHGMVNSLFT